jgi:hypothetical protein
MMSELPSSPTPINAEKLSDLLVELSRLKDEFERAKQTCVGGEDSIGEAQFQEWANRFGIPDSDDLANFPRYRRCMDSYEACSDQVNRIRHLPLLEPNSAVAELGRLFPSLRDAPGLEPFDESRFEEWMKSEASPIAVHAARFVLSVWENEPNFFNIVEAFRDWDDEHRDAYVAWFRRPLMPQRQLWGEL